MHGQGAAGLIGGGGFVPCFLRESAGNDGGRARGGASFDATAWSVLPGFCREGAFWCCDLHGGRLRLSGVPPLGIFFVVTTAVTTKYE